MADSKRGCPQRLFVAGHSGMVGSAVLRALQNRPDFEVVVRSHAELDLCRQDQVEHFFRGERPDTVVFAAGRVGGVCANERYPADFIRDNLLMASLSIEAAYRHGARRFLFLGSTCIYPRDGPQPIPEQALLTGPLEPTNEAYAIAKIAGLKMCQSYRRQYGVTFHSAMPTNLYGPGDNYHAENSHVLPALLRRFHEAELRRESQVVVWGSGAPRREFLHVDDLASALVFLLDLEHPPDIINVGTGRDIAIRELASLVAGIVGFRGTIAFDRSKPDGMPRKQTDIQRITELGWSPTIGLEEGIRQTYETFRQCWKQHTVRLD